MFELLEPYNRKVIQGKEFVLTSFPALQGRELIAEYAETHAPVIGKFSSVPRNEVVKKLMNYVAVDVGNGVLIRLSTEELIQNHAVTWERLVRIEAAMIEHNCSFFQDGRTWNFLASIAQNIKALITETWTELSPSLSPKEKQP